MDRTKAIPVLLEVNILAGLYMGYTIKESIHSSDNRTAEELRMLRHQVQQLDSQIMNGIRRELTAQADKVERLDYTFTEADLVQKKAQVGLQVALKEVSASAVI